MNEQHPRVLQGQNDVQLNQVGVHEAMALAKRLRKEDFDIVYSSDLKACQQTTEEITKDRADIKVLYDKRLREMDMGSFTGMTWTEVKKKLSQSDLRIESGISSSGEGESMQQFNARIQDFYKDMIQHHIVSPTLENFPTMPKSLTKVLVVTHGGWIRNLFDHLIEDLRFSIDGVETHGFPKNGSMYEFQIIQDMDKNDFEWTGHILLMNDVSHQGGMWKKMASEYTPNQSPNASPKLLRKVRQQQNAAKKAEKTDSSHKEPPPKLYSPLVQRKKSLGW